jgi:hypothetical protein
LTNEANTIIEKNSMENIPAPHLAERKGFRLVIIGRKLSNEDYENQGWNYLRRLGVNGVSEVEIANLKNSMFPNVKKVLLID